MQTSQKISLAEVEEPLRIVVVYEDPTAHLRARQTRDYLVNQLSGEMPLEFSWWSLGLLQETSQHDMAAGATARADLVIFSARPGDGWQPVVNSWIASWSHKREGRPGAIALIFSPPAADGTVPCGREIMLQGAASRAGMDFLPPPKHHLLACDVPKNDFVTRAAPVAPILHALNDHPDSSPYCGING